MPEVAAFNDDFRDGIKGSVFNASEGGFVQGNNNPTVDSRVRYGVVGGTNYPGLKLDGISYKQIWHTSPSKTINYVSAHDNNTLYDKLMLSTSFNLKQYVDEMQKQANAIVLTSQGIPFLHAGVEFMRSKPATGGTFDSNSYQSPDSVNQLRWDRKAETVNMEVFEYYKGLIGLRKAHPAFRMATSTEVLNNVDFVYEDKPNILAYTISNYANNDTWGTILVIHNNGTFVKLPLPAGSWNMVDDGKRVGTEVLKTYEEGSTVTVLDHETVILYQGEKAPETKGCILGCKKDVALLPTALFTLGLAYVVLRKKH
jgi:pullulanase